MTSKSENSNEKLTVTKFLFLLSTQLSTTTFHVSNSVIALDWSGNGANLKSE